MVKKGMRLTVYRDNLTSNMSSTKYSNSRVIYVYIRLFCSFLFFIVIKCLGKMEYSHGPYTTCKVGVLYWYRVYFYYSVLY